MKYADKLKPLLGQKGYIDFPSEYDPYFNFKNRKEVPSDYSCKVTEIGDDYIVIFMEYDGGNPINRTYTIPLNVFTVSEVNDFYV